jgi:hypothetical protein
MQKIMECLVFLVVACCLAMRTQLGSQIYMSQELLNMTLLAQLMDLVISLRKKWGSPI